jgi:hypothetical protein
VVTVGGSSQTGEHAARIERWLHASGKVCAVDETNRHGDAAALEPTGLRRHSVYLGSTAAKSSDP